ncbi:aldo/keto reductase [Halomonas cerina]|uniref:Aryl-alcohol dehydrogenase-like predicted oxidoreductase n=1 Tax=Halomonas cerina TaxID=447424 RepID=A0A839VA41_9GAMM|nr:aldo/keto reductase [Halomonas cerina]MBB3192352.1 aryl-alcohol dehydrogenase-like predicted oxidoreductase [Halomonas cerina]
MQKRKLGRSDIEIAPLVFGGNVFGWTTDEQRSFALLDRFIERGFNAIDTADVYAAWAPELGGGESETVLGQWLARRGRRDDIVLMSKVGMWEPHKGLSAANIEAAVEDSLKRLRTDYLDVYFAHIDDQDVPLEETLGAFARLIEAGKVRAIGASNYSAERLRKALSVSQEQGLPRYELIQPLYNLYDRDDFEAELASVAQEHALGVVSYFSLASGFLTGKYSRLEDLEGNARADFLKGYFDERGQAILSELLAVSNELGAKSAQVALAWLLSRPAVTAPIASATSTPQLDEVLDSVNLTLPDGALARLDAAGR